VGGNTDSYVATAGATDYTLGVTVTDSNGSWASNALAVSVNSGAQVCDYQPMRPSPVGPDPL